MNWLITKTRKNAPDTVPDAQCRGRSRFQRFNFSRQWTVHKVTLSVLRFRENSMCSMEMFTGQHTPYTFPIITEQCNVYSLSGNTSRFSQLLIQEWDFFALFPRDIKGNRIDNDDRFALLWAYLTVFPVPLGHPFHTARI